MGCGVVPGNVYALSGCHCGPHSSSIKESILNWHDRLFLVEVAALRSIVLRYAGAPIATRVSFFFPFVHLEMSLFPSIFCTVSAFSFV